MKARRIAIDPDFKARIVPLSADERQLLDASIRAEGCRDALVVWEEPGILLDGHNRYEICKKHGIAYDVVELSFSNREAAEDWIDRNQLGRRNLTPDMFKFILGRLYNRTKKAHGGNRESSPQNEDLLKTAEVLAREHGVSKNTVERAGKAVAEIEKAPELLQRVMSGDLSVNLAAQVAELPEEDRQAVAEAPSEEVREVARDAVRKAHVAYNSGNNEWYTPAYIVEAARAVLGGIDLDPASTEAANEVVQATTYYTAEQDGLTRPWAGRVWMNPPYASGLIERFTEKLWEEVIAGRIEAACVLTNNATETKWFTTLASVASAVCFPEGRVKFWSPCKDSATPLQGQAVIYIGDNEAAFSREFEEIGTVWIKSVARSVIGNAHLN